MLNVFKFNDEIIILKTSNVKWVFILLNAQNLQKNNSNKTWSKLIN